MRKAQAEIDFVLINGTITAEKLKKLEYVTYVTISCELNYVRFFYTLFFWVQIFLDIFVIYL